MKLLNLTYRDFDSLKDFVAQNGIRNSNALLIQLFFSNRTPEKALAVRDEVKSILPEASLIATSTSGIIADGTLQDDAVILSFSLFEKSKTASFACGGDVDTIIRNLGEKVVTEKTKLLVIFANTFRFDSTELLKKLTGAFPRIVLAGGNAGDDFRFAGCHVFTMHEDDADVVIAAIDSDDLTVRTEYLFNWQSIGQEMQVSRSSGSTVYEINGERVLDIYEHYLGSDISGNILEYGIEFPLIYEQGGVLVARAAVAVDEEAGSITFAGEIPEGVEVTFGYANVEHIERNNRVKLEETFRYRQEGIYVYSCGSRR